MPLEDARKFVAKMKENPEFRKEIVQAVSPEELHSLLYEEGMSFNQQELVGAMAECMAQMEQQMRS